MVHHEPLQRAVALWHGEARLKLQRRSWHRTAARVFERLAKDAADSCVWHFFSAWRTAAVSAAPTISPWRFGTTFTKENVAHDVQTPPTAVAPHRARSPTGDLVKVVASGTMDSSGAGTVAVACSTRSRSPIARAEDVAASGATAISGKVAPLAIAYAQVRSPAARAEDGAASSSMTAPCVTSTSVTLPVPVVHANARVRPAATSATDGMVASSCKSQQPFQVQGARPTSPVRPLSSARGAGSLTLAAKDRISSTPRTSGRTLPWEKQLASTRGSNNPTRTDVGGLASPTRSAANASSGTLGGLVGETIASLGGNPMRSGITSASCLLGGSAGAPAAMASRIELATRTPSPDSPVAAVRGLPMSPPPPRSSVPPRWADMGGLDGKSSQELLGRVQTPPDRRSTGSLIAMCADGRGPMSPTDRRSNGFFLAAACADGRGTSPAPAASTSPLPRGPERFFYDTAGYTGCARYGGHKVVDGLLGLPTGAAPPPCQRVVGAGVGDIRRRRSVGSPRRCAFNVEL
mmetsp:Transcript_22187/g.62202  ORF Transcript_22187/g.62202 Transcript_22187/m.62202 type:complete len:520 (+) Transcript_22187:2-1561(+)